MVKQVFITGASSGIGLAASRELCARGHEVWGTARSHAALPGFDRFHPIVLDLNDEGSIESAFRQALAEAGHFDVLINNAGVGVFGPFEAFAGAEFSAQLQTLLAGPAQLIRLALPGMRAHGAGMIVNVSSVAGELPLPFMAPYSSCKAALSALTQGLNLELAHTGVRVIELRPSEFATPFHSSTRRLGAALAQAYAPNVEHAWRAIGRNMARAPDVKMAIDALVGIVEGRISRPVVRVGNFFQSRLAPYVSRHVPGAWVQWGIRLYYGLRVRPR
jgi:NAD(P)-dependent dehydrogenase (short-subunit alcohol dehydrogenase family)